MVVQYQAPDHWIKYDLTAIAEELISAKSAVLSLSSIPFQRSWADRLQEVELKREIAGTSRIEGAEFTERELDEALLGTAKKEDMTRSQRQAMAASKAYKWIANLPAGRPIDLELIRTIHRLIVTDCDDDHCPPGIFRGAGHNVVFGRPRHRGVEGGAECERMLGQLVQALNGSFRSHDPLVQALAFHYHFAAMHPFDDGNGRTARALEAFMLQRAQMKDSLFVAMSNYYYDEKNAYLDSLARVREENGNLNAFLKFGLKGIASQCQRLLREIRGHVQKSLFRDVMNQMYGRLQSSRKRALAGRQCQILNTLLDRDRPIEYRDLYDIVEKNYFKLDGPIRAFVRDLNGLSSLRAIRVRVEGEKEAAQYLVEVRAEWATEITDTEFFRQVNKLPAAKTRLFVTQ